MTFKASSPEFRIIDVTMIEPDANHPRQNVDEASLKSLANSIQKIGVIHPLLVRPASAGRYTVIVGERRRQAAILAGRVSILAMVPILAMVAILAGEQTVPVLIRPCAPEDALEVQVFENIGLGVRTALEPRDMANAIQKIAERFETAEQAAQHFGRAPTWLSQATAAANLSEKVVALLDSGKISSTSAAVQLEKLAKKNEAKAESLIGRIEQLPEGEKASKKLVDSALSEESGRKKKEIPVVEDAPAPIAATAGVPPWEEAPLAPPASAARSRVNPGKVRQVAELLGLNEGDEEEILIRLIDEFLALKQA